MKSTTYIPLTVLSEQAGLPAAWLKAEADAGRIPCLRAGRRLMFDAEAVKKALADRMVEALKQGQKNA